MGQPSGCPFFSEDEVMAKVHSALFSLGASGTVAKILTINQSSRQQTARKKPDSRPAPTLAQSYNRQKYSDAAQHWHTLTATERAQWAALVNGRALSVFAKYALEWVAQGSTPLEPPRIPMA
jgi:hypothetical protein